MNTQITSKTITFDPTPSKPDLIGSFTAKVTNPDNYRQTVQIVCKVHGSYQHEDPRFDHNTNLTKVYIFDQNSINPLTDIVSGYRYNRPYDWYKTWVPNVIEMIYQEAGYNLGAFKLSWTQYCGCTCPCSPGFLIRDSQGWARFHLFTSIYIEIQVFMAETEELVSVEAVGI
jgi:hypothetical protein